MNISFVFLLFFWLKLSLSLFAEKKGTKERAVPPTASAWRDWTSSAPNGFSKPHWIVVLSFGSLVAALCGATAGAGIDEKFVIVFWPHRMLRICAILFLQYNDSGANAQ